MKNHCFQPFASCTLSPDCNYSCWFYFFSICLPPSLPPSALCSPRPVRITGPCCPVMEPGIPLNGSVRRRVSILLMSPLLLLCPRSARDPSKRLALSPTLIAFLRRNLLCSLNWANIFRVCVGQLVHMNLLFQRWLYEIWIQVRYTTWTLLSTNIQKTVVLGV